MKSAEQRRCHDGVLEVFDHDSAELGCSMRFAVFLPPQAEQGPVPCLWYLSGLTCTWANVMEKGEILRAAAKAGCAIVAPDTSPRGDDVADDPGYDLGQGAGFYLTATEAPWAKHFRMDSYLTNELQSLITQRFPIDQARQGIFGHSMGGHGAITLHLKNPDMFKTCSAFAPILAPSNSPWGEKAFSSYLGSDRSKWSNYDSTMLVKDQPSPSHILIDQGSSDPFLEDQLLSKTFEEAATTSGQPYTLRMQAGYDHSYFFIATFMDDHVQHHMEQLRA